VTGEQRVLAIEHDRADASFDGIGVELDAAVTEQAGEPVKNFWLTLSGVRGLAGAFWPTA
jgi:hypothetical protein